MGKIISVIHVSLDGYMADANGQINFIPMNEEVHDYVMELRQGAAGTIYGRTTYEIMESYWPNVPGNPDLPKWQHDYAEWVNKALKVVVSRSLDSFSWHNTRLIRDNVVEEVRRIKEETGDLLLLASRTLVAALLPERLIDEVVVTISPVILGKGRPFFMDLADRMPLELLETRKFSNGMVSLKYVVR